MSDFWKEILKIFAKNMLNVTPNFVNIFKSLKHTVISLRWSSLSLEEVYQQGLILEEGCFMFQKNHFLALSVISGLHSFSSSEKLEFLFYFSIEKGIYLKMQNPRRARTAEANTEAVGQVPMTNITWTCAFRVMRLSCNKSWHVEPQQETHIFRSAIFS